MRAALLAIRQILSISGLSVRELAAAVPREMQCRRREIEKQFVQNRKEQEGIRVKGSEQYAGYCLGTNSREYFIRGRKEASARLEILQRRQKEMERRLEKMNVEPGEWEAFIQILLNGGWERSGAEAYDRELLAGKETAALQALIGSLIRRIEVYSDPYVKISFGVGREKKGE